MDTNAERCHVVYRKPMAQTTFLLVEDDPDDVVLVKRCFKIVPVETRLSHVSDGIEATRYLEGEGSYADRRKYPIPDVILLDLKMPRFSGFDFLAWLRSKTSAGYPLIPVVVLSSSGLPADVMKAYSLGVNSFLVKPVSWRDFKERITTIVVYWSHAQTPGLAIAGPNPPVDTLS